MNAESQSHGPTTGPTYGAAFADVYDQWYANVTNVDDTVDTLIRLAGGGNLLELGVGTGRIAVPLARRLSGRQRITGIDESEEMLSVWRAKLANDETAAHRSIVHRGDMAEPVAGGPYSVVFCTFNTFFNLPTHDAQRSCLRNVARVLAPGGTVVLEYAVFPDDGRDIDGRFIGEHRRPDGTTVTSTTVVDPSEHTVSGHFRDTAGIERPWTIRYATPAMIDAMANDAGLVAVDRWEDFGRRPFVVGSARQVCVLRRRLGTR